MVHLRSRLPGPKVLDRVQIGNVNALHLVVAAFILLNVHGEEGNVDGVYSLEEHYGTGGVLGELWRVGKVLPARTSEPSEPNEYELSGIMLVQ